MNEKLLHLSGEVLKTSVIDFSTLNDNSLSTLTEALGLKMSPSDLHICLKHYKSERLPAPTSGELMLIDKVFSDKENRLSSRLIASFSTNDKRVAETYADLMSRRRAIDPDHALPCSVTDLLNILPAFAFDNKDKEITLLCGKNRAAKAAMAGYRGFSFSEQSDRDALIGIKTDKSQNTTPNLGDAIYAVLKSFNDEDGFEQRLDEFISSAEVASASKQIDILENESIITLLSENYDGVRLNLQPYEAKSGDYIPFELLAKSDSGVTICASKQTAADMLIAAQERGLRVVILGSANGSLKIEAQSRLGNRLTLDIKLLRSLGFPRPIYCEADRNDIPQSRAKAVKTAVINQKNYKLCSSERCNKDAFTSGFESVLYAYSTALLGGTDTIYAGAYTLPLTEIDPKSLGTSLELILGAYRAQCELGIYESFHSVERGDSPSLRFHALTEVKSEIPTKIVGKGSYIYYLEPRFLDNGLPDFDDLKKMHRYISSLIKDNILLSAYPTGNDLITALDRMSKDTCVEYVRRDELPARVGGFIIEATQRIQGAYIARTTPPRSEYTEANGDFSQIPEQIALGT